MTDFRGQVANIAQDLLNLEVNTIIKPSITGSKMPRPRHALLDIGNEYVVRLQGMGVTEEDVKTVHDNQRYGSYQAFDKIRTVADKRINILCGLGASLTPEQEADLFMLLRIRDMSDQIKGVFNELRVRERDRQQHDNDFTHLQIEGLEPVNGRTFRPPDLNLNQNQLILLRKIWEVGTEEIAMQTVIQLDGDVVTRLLPKYSLGKDELLHRIHQEGVKASVGFWKDLIGIARDLLGSLFRLMSPAG
jgi:hypothetical protein